jgi:palmitoyltransferase
MEEKLDHLITITDCYYLLINDNSKFFTWYLQPNKDDLTPLDISAQTGNKPVLLYLFEIISKTTETHLHLTDKRNNVFHNAAQSNQSYPIIFFHEKLQRYFPEHNLINTPNENNITPLHYACYKGHKNVVDLLIDLGADVNAVDCENKSVLFYACVGGDVHIVKKLLIYGADKTIKDDDNKLPYDIAVEKNKYEIAMLLKNKTFITRLCSFELGSIIGIRHDYMILILYCIYYMCWGLLAEVFVHNLTHSTSITTYNAVISSNNAIVEKTLMILSFVFVSLSCGYAASFVCCFKRRKIKHKSSQYELLELINKNYNVCVKCRKAISDNTVHCIVCDVCIDNWDHHCFWLNTCIDKHVKGKFNMFFILLFLALLNHVLLGIALLVKVHANGEFYNTFIFNSIISNNVICVILTYILLMLYLMLFLFPLLFSLIPFCKETLCTGGRDIEYTDINEHADYLQNLMIPQRHSSMGSSNNYSF